MHTAGTLLHSPVASVIFYFLSNGTFASTVCLPFTGFKYGTAWLSQQTGVFACLWSHPATVVHPVPFAISKCAGLLE